LEYDMATLLDGKAVAATIRNELKVEIADFAQKTGSTPGLSCVIVGEDPASRVYARRIGAVCAEVGIRFDRISLPSDSTPCDLEQQIIRLNADPSVSGVIVQMPLPKHLPSAIVTQLLDPRKDIDGVTPKSAGELFLGQPTLAPSTPRGGLELLRRYGVPIAGAEAVIVGRSSIVGKPMASLLIAESATVTICHSRTRDLSEVTRRADILLVAIGRPRFITADMVKPGAVVVDFGINPTDGGIVGDVDFDAVAIVAGSITPTPGGTGPMTNAMLMANTLAAAKRFAGVAG
jgi:methylenetetrahydrofolate dehydrogenase (NADP+)/methenyltetrahydrofolate cyclohydrolase